MHTVLNDTRVRVSVIMVNNSSNFWRVKVILQVVELILSFLDA